MQRRFVRFRRIVRSIAYVLLAVLSALTAASAEPVDLTTVTLRVADQAGQLQSKLNFAGLLEGAPYRIEWSVFPAAVNIHEALKAGAVDLGFAGSGPTVSALAGGSPIQVVASWDTAGRGVYLLVPEKSPIRSVADLRGKTISPTGRGSAGHYIVVQALLGAGLSVNDVNLAFLNPTEASAAFSTGAIDAWGTWGVWGIRAIGSQGARVLIDTTSLKAEVYLASATRSALAEPAKIAAIRDLVERVDRSYRWTREHPDSFVKWFTVFAKQDVETAVKAQESEAAWRRIPVDDAVAGRLQDTFATWVAGGVLKGKFDAAATLYRGL